MHNDVRGVWLALLIVGDKNLLIVGGDINMQCHHSDAPIMARRLGSIIQSGSTKPSIYGNQGNAPWLQDDKRVRAGTTIRDE